ncbi:MAG: MarR family winged helix-turn-helix transcriptional regulator [Alphaproteobacteria bacterium]
MPRHADTNDVLPEPKDLTALFERAEVPDLYRLSYITNALVLPLYDAVKRDFDLSRGEYLLLFCLSHFPVLTARDVAEMSKRPRNTISRAVHRMLNEGYINRVPDPEDGRQARLTITQSGRELHDRVMERFRSRETQGFQILDKDDRVTLDRILQKLALHIAFTLD